MELLASLSGMCSHEACSRQLPKSFPTAKAVRLYGSTRQVRTAEAAPHPGRERRPPSYRALRRMMMARGSYVAVAPSRVSAGSWSCRAVPQHPYGFAIPDPG